MDGVVVLVWEILWRFGPEDLSWPKIPRMHLDWECSFWGCNFKDSNKTCSFLNSGLDPASLTSSGPSKTRSFAGCWAGKGLFACMCQPFFGTEIESQKLLPAACPFAWFSYPIISWLSLSEVDFNPTSASYRDRFHQWCCCLVWPYGWIVASFWDWFLWKGYLMDGILHWLSSWLLMLLY